MRDALKLALYANILKIRIQTLYSKIVNSCFFKNNKDKQYLLNFESTKLQNLLVLRLIPGFHFWLVVQNYRVCRIMGYGKIQIFQLTNLCQRVACTRYLNNLWSNEKP